MVQNTSPRVELSIDPPTPPSRVAAFDDFGAYAWDEKHPDQFTVTLRFLPGVYSEVALLPDGCFHIQTIRTTHRVPDFRGMSVYLARRYHARPIGYLPEVADVH